MKGVSPVWYWFFKCALFGPLVRLVVRPKVTGRENIPSEGGAVLAANHATAFETIILPASVHRRVTFPAKAELFAPGQRFPSSVVAWFLGAIGQIPLNREGGRASANALEPIVDALSDGRLVGIFPEGTRTPDGRLYRGKTGVARLALQADVPVIPVGLVRTAPRWWGRVPYFRGTEIRIGRPLAYPEFAGRHVEGPVTRWVTDDVMAAIQDLTGQEYVEVYGARVKHGGLSISDADAKVKPTPLSGKNRPQEAP